MTWKKFNKKTAIPTLPHDTIMLDRRSNGSIFTIENWQDIGQAPGANS